MAFFRDVPTFQVVCVCQAWVGLQRMNGPLLGRFFWTMTKARLVLLSCSLVGLFLLEVRGQVGPWQAGLQQV